MQDGLNSVTNLVCSVGYEASTANQRKQLNVFDSRNHLGFLFFLVLLLYSIGYCLVKSNPVRLEFSWA